MHHIQQGHTYANTAKTYLVNINAVNQWIARYKKDGIKGLNEKPHTGRIGLFAKHSLTKIDKCCDAWNDILKKDNFVKKLCSREWIELV